MIVQNGVDVQRIFHGANPVDKIVRNGATVAKRWVNLFTNPSFETAGSDQTLFTNLFPNPSCESSSGTETMFTNLVMNPSIEHTASPLTLLTNLFTNPSFETAGAAVEVRRNYCPNPRAVEAGGNWNVAGSGGVNAALSWSTTEGHLYGTSAVATCPGTNATEGLYIYNTMAISSGEVFKAGCWVKAPSGTSLYIFLRVTGDGGGDAQTNFVATGAWQWVETPTKTAAAAGTNIMVGVRTAVAAAVVFNMTEVMIEKSSALGAYFDGTASLDSDFTPAWSGSTNASPSYITGLTVPGFTGMGGRYAIQSSQWASSGGKSIRIVHAGLSGANSANGIWTATLASMGVTTGQKITVSADIRMPAASSASIDATKGLRIFISSASGATPIASSTAATNAAGVTRLSLTYTSVNASDEILRLGGTGGGPATGDVWWDALVLAVSSYDIGYFDGDSSPKVRRSLCVESRMRGTQDVSRVGGWNGSKFTVVLEDGYIDLVSTEDGAIGSYNTHRFWEKNYSKIPNGVPVTIAYDLETISLTNPPFVLAHMPQFGVDTGLVTRDTLGRNDKTLPAVGQKERIVIKVTSIRDYAAFAIGFQTPGSNTETNRFMTGDTLRVSNLVVEIGDTTGDYFDGDVSPDDRYLSAWEGTADASRSYLYDRDFATSWSGTVHASTSAIQVPRPTYHTGSTTNAVGIQSDLWASHGSKCLRLVVHPTVTHGDTNITIAGSNSSLTGQGVTFVPGTTYTVQALFKVVDPLTGTLYPICAIGLAFSDSVNGFRNVVSQAPNVTGEHPVTITFTVPAGATWASVRVYHGGLPNSGSIWVDDLVIVEGEYSPGYFDGGTSPDSELTPSWGGTEHLSVSNLSGSLVTSLSREAQVRVLRSPAEARSGTYSARVIKRSLSASGAGAKYTFTGTSGKTYTFGCWMKRGVGDAQPFITAPGIGGTSGLTLTDDWQWFTYTWVSNYTGNNIIAVNAGTATVPGSEVFIDDIVLVEGSYLPGYFDGDAPPKLRRNLAEVTQGTASTPSNQIGFRPQWWGSTGATGVMYYGLSEADLPESCLSFVRRQNTVVNGGLNLGYDLTPQTEAYRPKVTPGKALAVSFYWRHNLENPVVNGSSTYQNIRATFYNEAGSQIEVQYFPYTKYPNAGVWQKESFVTVPPAGASSVWIVFPFSVLTPVAGQQLDCTALLVEESPTNDAFFDGNTSPDPRYAGAWEGTENASPSYLHDADFFTAWNGTAHASTSVIKAPGVLNAVGTSLVCSVVQSKHWTQSADYSIRVMPAPNAGTYWTNAIVAGSSSNLVGQGVTFVPGKTYTVFATLRIEDVLSGTVAPSTKCIEVQYAATSTGTVTLRSTASPNSPGVYPHAITFTIPNDATRCSVRLYNGHTLGDVWWDDAILVEGDSTPDYPGGYFDGDTNPGFTRWLGTAHASQSDVFQAIQS